MKRIQDVKAHIQKYKTVYITGGVCLVVGVLSGGAYALTRPDVTFTQKATLIGWKNRNVQVQFVEFSTASKPIHLVGTQKYWNSISSAARDTGIDRTLISKCINEHIPDAKGLVFELVDVAS